MLKTLLAFSAAALLTAPCLQAQSRNHENLARGSYEHGDYGRHGNHGHYYYLGGVPYFYPFYGVGFGYPGYAYGYGIGFNEPYYGYGYPGDAAYEGRIVQNAPPGNGDPSNSLPAAVQRLLAKAGYYKGPIDGEFGPASRSALSRYQHKNGLNETGRIDEPTLQALGFSDHR